MLTTLPTIPDSSMIEYQTKIAVVNGGGSPNNPLYSQQTTYSYLVVGLPQNYVVCGAMIQLVQQFKGGTLTSLTCSLGAFVPNSILTDPTFYSQPYELTQLASNMTFQTSGLANNGQNYTLSYSPAIGLFYNGPHDVAAYFTATGANLSALTQGSVEISVLIRPL